jgi:hypothetical protein
MSSPEIIGERFIAQESKQREHSSKIDRLLMEFNYLIECEVSNTMTTPSAFASIDQIPAALIQAGIESLLYEIHTFLNSI